MQNSSDGIGVHPLIPNYTEGAEDNTDLGLGMRLLPEAEERC